MTYSVNTQSRTNTASATAGSEEDSLATRTQRPSQMGPVCFYFCFQPLFGIPSQQRDYFSSLQNNGSRGGGTPPHWPRPPRHTPHRRGQLDTRRPPTASHSQLHGPISRPLVPQTRPYCNSSHRQPHHATKHTSPASNRMLIATLAQSLVPSGLYRRKQASCLGSPAATQLPPRAKTSRRPLSPYPHVYPSWGL